MSDEPTVLLPAWATPAALRELILDMTTEHITALLNVMFAVLVDRHVEVCFDYQPDPEGGPSRFAGIRVLPSSGDVRLSTERELSKEDVDDFVTRALRDPVMREALIWLVLRLQTERDIARERNRRGSTVGGG